jgi:hypothetical protein
LQGKTPFEISSNPLAGITTSRAGLSAVSRVLRAINRPGMCEANLALKKRRRGFVPRQVAESLVLLHAAGGDGQGDRENLRQDSGLTKMLGYQVPSARCTGDFLALFHDEDILRKAREAAEAQGKRAILPEESSPLCGLGRVVKGTVTSISRLEEEPLEKATIEPGKVLAPTATEPSASGPTSISFLGNAPRRKLGCRCGMSDYGWSNRKGNFSPTEISIPITPSSPTG